MINDWFDKYSLQARLAPALLTLFPIILLAAIQFPQLYETAAGLVGLLVACGVLTIASHFARTRGRSVEKRLNKKWGSRPTTRFLVNEDSELDAGTRRRYVIYFSQHIPDWHLGENPKDDFDSAVRWLLEKTRDTTVFGLIFKENISYGFRRNCLGMKPFGLTIAFLCTAYWGFQTYSQYIAESHIELITATGLSVSILLFLWWLFVVGEGWVEDAGNAYAKALLGSIDMMS